MFQAVSVHISIPLGVLSVPEFHSFVRWCIKTELVTIQFEMCFWVPVKGIFPLLFCFPLLLMGMFLNSDWSFSKFLGQESCGLLKIILTMCSSKWWSLILGEYLIPCTVFNWEKKCNLLVVLARSYLDGRHILGRVDSWCCVSSCWCSKKQFWGLLIWCLFRVCNLVYI